MASEGERPTVALLSVPGSYAVDTLVATGRFEFTSVDLEGLPTSPYACPYGLPARRSGDTVVPRFWVV